MHEVYTSPATHLTPLSYTRTRMCNPFACSRVLLTQNPLYSFSHSTFCWFSSIQIWLSPLLLLSLPFSFTSICNSYAINAKTSVEPNRFYRIMAKKKWPQQHNENVKNSKIRGSSSKFVSLCHLRWPRAYIAALYFAEILCLFKSKWFNRFAYQSRVCVKSIDLFGFIARQNCIRRVDRF